MAHFAQIDASGIVQRVIVVPDSEEANGAQWCANLYGGTWVQTSYHGRIRKNYAGIGYTYDAVRDAFIPPQPFSSWILNDESCRWEAPTEPPTNGVYVWDEESNMWISAEGADEN